MTAKSASVFRGAPWRSSLFSLLCAASPALGASVVWNPIEDKYDRQLTRTVVLGPKGCKVVSVAKNTRIDRVEAILSCDLAPTSELFAEVYPAEDGWRIPTVGGGGSGGSTAGAFGPTGTTAILSPTTSGTPDAPTLTGSTPTVTTGTTTPTTTTVAPTLSPVVPTTGGGTDFPEDSSGGDTSTPVVDSDTNDPTDGGSNDPTDGGANDPTDGGTIDPNEATGGSFDPFEIVSGGTEVEDDPLIITTGSTTSDSLTPSEIPLPAPFAALLLALSTLRLVVRRRT